MLISSQNACNHHLVVENSYVFWSLSSTPFPVMTMLVLVIFMFYILNADLILKCTWSPETTSPSERSLESWNREELLWNRFLVQLETTYLDIEDMISLLVLVRPQSSKMTTAPSSSTLRGRGKTGDSSNLLIWPPSLPLSFSEARERESFEYQLSKNVSRGFQLFCQLLPT